MSSLSHPVSDYAAVQAQMARQKTTLWLVCLILLGLLVPVAGYILLPAIGIKTFMSMFTVKKSVLLFIMAIGGFAYFVYLKYILQRPQLLLLFIAVAWPVVDYLNILLLDYAHVNIHLRPLLMVSIGFPCLWFCIKNGREIGAHVPYFKYYAAFFTWLFIYFLFFNGFAVDPRFDNGNVWSEGSVGIIQLTAYFYCLMAITVAAYCVLKIRNFSNFFDSLNKILLLLAAIESILTIAGYPFNLFSMNLDGFKRALGIFSHPNPFAHHMGILLVYSLGLFCYYQGPNKKRMPSLILIGCTAVNLIAFFLGLSKTALGVFGLCATVIFMLNLSSPVVRRGFFQIIIALIFIVPLGLFAYEAIAGQSFFSILEARIDQTQSLNWRTEIWEGLISNINATSVWFGHGFTSANAFIFQLGFNDENNAKPLMMVHNGYIALLYDLGIMGYLMFLAVISLAFNTTYQMLKNGNNLSRPLLTTILGLCLYFLIVCAFDEMTYMFDAPMLFWTLTTLMYCMAVKESHA